MLADRLETLVAVVGFAPRGTVVAVGNVAPSERPDVTELALLVEDDWQGPGLGTAMARHLPRAG